MGGLNEVRTLAVFSDGRHDWRIGKSIFGYQQKEKTTFLSGSGALDE